jgi:hypothetical protein
METKCATITLSTVNVRYLIQKLTAKDVKSSALLDAEIAMAIGYYDYKLHSLHAQGSQEKATIALHLKSDTKHCVDESEHTIQVNVRNAGGGGLLSTEDLPQFSASLDAVISVLSPVIALGPEWRSYYKDPRASKWTWGMEQNEVTQQWQATAGVRSGTLGEGTIREQAIADTGTMALMAAILKLRESLKTRCPDLLVPYDPDAEITQAT